METARKELGRLMAFKNPHSWAVPDKDDDMEHRYFFLDRDTESKHGDTPLLRLLALHACPKTVGNFLFRAEVFFRQEAQADSVGDGEALGEMTAMRQVLRSNHHGVSPLHVALNRNSWYVGEIVRLLLSVDPSLVRRRMTSTGSYPLHVSMANNLTIQSKVLQDLLAADPSIVYEEDFNSDNPVSLLYKNVLRFRWARDWMIHNHTPESMVSDSSWMTVIAPDQFRDFCLAMMSAAQTHKCGDCKLSWHSICAFPRCPPLLIKILGMELPCESLLQADEDGRVPLHHAARALAISMSSIPLHILDESASVLKLVLRLEPRAAFFADRHGKYPLHYALENITIESYVIEELIGSSPVEALMTPDDRTGLLPFQLAAARQEVDGAPFGSSLIYSLLRLEPSATHVM